MEPPEARRDTSAPGQAAEFRVWAELIQQSRGMLHIFLPLLDRGLDAVVHRLTDGEYIPLQIKSRGVMVEGMVEVVIRGDSLVDDRALIIAGLLTDDGLGPTLLVVDRAPSSGSRRTACRKESRSSRPPSACTRQPSPTGDRTSCHARGWPRDCSALSLRFQAPKPRVWTLA